MTAGTLLSRLLPPPASRGSGRAHRVFHPLCGATLPVLLRTLASPGAVAPGRVPAAVLALASGVFRLPFTLAESLAAASGAPAPGQYRSPVFIVGHWRSGTTHLANLLSRSGHFGILSPMAVGLPAEALGLGRIGRPFVEQFFPTNRLIDDVALRSDFPQEDELAMANLSTLSSQHGIYAPRQLLAAFDRALFGLGVDEREQARWAHTLERYVAKMTWDAGGRPLLIRNPASSTRIAALRRIWPDARFIHIHRDPEAVVASSIATFATLLRELALGPVADPERSARTLVRHVYPRLLAALLDATDRLPQGTCVSVPHAALADRPMATVGLIADTLSLERDRAGDAAMQDYADRHRRDARRRTLDDDDRRWLEAQAAVTRRLGYGAEPAAAGSSGATLLETAA